MSLASRVTDLAVTIRDKINLMVPRLMPAGGSTGQALVKTSGSNYAAGWQTVGLVEPDPLDLETTEPLAPATDVVRLFRRPLANRQFPAFKGASGLTATIQPLFATNKVGYWSPPGNASTVPGVVGFTAFTATGTATARNVATTNLFTRMRRLGYVSAATAAAIAGARVGAAQITTGTTLNGIPVGGFFKVIRFGISDAAAVAGARMFVGIGSASAPANVEPSTLTNSIGVGHGAANTNLFLYWGGSQAQPPIDLGPSFPTNTLNTDVYELALFCPPGSVIVHYEVTRLNTGDRVTGTLTGTAGTQLPSSTTLLSYSQNWRTNNATALAVGLDIFSDYIETDF